MTTTTDIARAHGHTGPTFCQDCGTTDNLHVLVWANPETGESGMTLECCDCGIAAGDPPEVHDECEPDEPEEEPAPDLGPVVRICRDDLGWVMRDYTDLEQCTSNHFRAEDGRPACTAKAVWKVVEDHGMHLTLSFWCDADLPDEYKPQAPAPHRDSTAA